ncbi:MAG: alpha-2-macroglobulin [Betaproteobacteria bacterium RIFCSPLOWO2_02_64_14]|nr:MAG: alpha-2-macroglobulin [Betaproteobacteria bacterium RIFCSPLOWO2_02_64_14]
MATNTRRRIIVASLLAVALAAGAYGLWNYFSTLKPAVERGDLQPVSGELMVMDCKSRLFDESPAIAIAFSHPVERKQSFDKLISVTDHGPAQPDKPAGKAASTQPVEGKPVGGNWVVGDNPRILYFPYVSPQRAYRVEIRAGIAGRSGGKLQSGSVCEVATEEMPPSFYFASRGVVLPAGQNGGLPIVTVNVPEVDMQFLRVNPENLPAFIEKVFTTRRSAQSQASREDEERDEDDGPSRKGRLKGRVGGWDLDQFRNMTRSVYLGRFLTDERKNRRHTTFIPVESIKELQEPGIYVAVMSHPGRFRYEYQVTYFYVSDIGVHVRRHGDQVHAFATSLKSGKAVSDVAFEVIDANSKTLARAQGDTDGHAVLTGIGEKGNALFARRGRELTVIGLREPALDLSEFDVGGHLSRNAKLFAYSGRNLYRPGEQFELSVLSRDPDGNPVPAAPLAATLKRPDGRTVQTMMLRAHGKVAGYFQRTLNLPPDAQTGGWQLEVRADPGARAPDSVYRFQVEEFLPERMKLDLRADKERLAPGDKLTVAAQGDYLFGAPAAGNRLLGSVVIERQSMPLAQKWPGFLFGDFADDDKRKRVEIEEAKLDDNGRASVEVPVEVGAARSPMLVRASFSLLESGGRPVVRSIERTLWPAAALIAVRPLFDRNVAQEGSLAEFEVVRLTPAGALAPLAAAQLRVIREERQYYWRFDDQRGWHSGYTESEELVETGAVALKERTKIKVPVRWGRYRIEIHDPEHKQTLRYRFYAGWGAQDAESLGNRPDRVQLALDKAPVTAGDRVRLTITPPHDGEALVTVEADRILWVKRVSVSTKGTAVDIQVSEQWKRHDIYVSAVVFRPGSQGERVTPARAVGLIHLPLARGDRKLKVAVEAPEKVLPERRTNVKVRVEGAAAQSAYVTLSAVDVGILNITRFKTPDPFDFFFGKHRYAPELLDIYGKLIEKMEGSRGRLKWGGDAGMRDTRSLPKKVKLVDLFSGPVALDAKGEADIALDLPDFNGTLRLMAVASSAERFGHGEREMIVAAPVVAELATPRFISAGDLATLALDVTNLSGGPQELAVRLEAASPVRIVDGERRLSLKDKQRTTLRFAAEATEAYGLGLLKLHVTGGGNTPIKIVRESVLQVQPPAPLEREVRRFRLEPNATINVESAWLDKYYRASAAVSVTVSNRPPFNVANLVKGLLDYPYGCLEQTTSAAYPHVFIDEAAAKAYGLQPRSRDERANFIEGALGRIAGMQKANGGFTLWGDGPYELWASAYVIGFMQDAREAGFTVPAKMYERAQEWLLAQLQRTPGYFPSLPAALQAAIPAKLAARDYGLLRDSHQRFAELAHIAYILARDQKAPLATLRILHDQYRGRARSPLPLIHLSLALKAMGDEARAKVALDEAMQRAYGIRPDPVGGYSEWLGDYGTSVRDYALSYALLARNKIEHPQRESLVFEVANRLGARSYYSTQERLALVLAARAAGGAGDTEWTALLKTGAASTAVSSRTSETRVLDTATLAKGVQLASQHKEALFVEVDISGYPVKPPAPRSDVIELTRTWFEPDGTRYAGRPLKVGEMLIVLLQAKSKRRVEDGLLIDRIPSGFEVENLNLSQGPRAQEFKIGGVDVAKALADSRIKHREYRDDRYVAAARLDGALNVVYLVRVVTPGKFAVPAPFAEDMYRPEIRGVGTTGGAISIIDPVAPPQKSEPPMTADERR